MIQTKGVTSANAPRQDCGWLKVQKEINAVEVE